jgi:nucleotidyltransferase/DNA polymerase involved in DNA repair
MAIQAGCGARPGCGRPSPRGEHAMPRLRNALRVCSAGSQMRPVRIAAARRSRCAQHIVDRPCRLRRVLCHRREARAAGTRRPTGHRRRRRARSVLACCYVSRLYGVRSAMPMFKALAACPAAVVIRPDMAKYRDVGRAVRTELRRLTPLVEPVSIDEAFLDLSGTEKLYGAVPAQLLATLAQKVEATLKVTLSIGLNDSKFSPRLPPISISRAALRSSAAAMRQRSSVSLLWGVGAALQRRRRPARRRQRSRSADLVR